MEDPERGLVGFSAPDRFANFSSDEIGRPTIPPPLVQATPFAFLATIVQRALRRRFLQRGVLSWSVPPRRCAERLTLESLPMYS